MEDHKPDLPNSIPLKRTPKNVKALFNAGYTKTEIGSMLGVCRQTVSSMINRIDNQKKETESVISNLKNLFGDTIGKTKIAIDKTLDWYNGLEEDDFLSLPWSAKKGFGDLAVMAQTHSYNNLRLEQDRSTSNISISLSIKELDSIKSTKDDLEDQLKKLGLIVGDSPPDIVGPSGDNNE